MKSIFKKPVKVTKSISKLESLEKNQMRKIFGGNEEEEKAKGTFKAKEGATLA